MEFNRRLESFLELKNQLQKLSPRQFQDIANRASRKNPWFTEDNVKFAFEGLLNLLNEKSMKAWIENYDFDNKIASKTIGVIMAGNIPAVGFHDLLCVLLSGHRLQAKLSSQDNVLLPFIAEKLISLDKSWSERISFAEKLQDFDSVIATGSDNTSRYFEYYFKEYPRILRKNRTSVAVIKGDEKPEDLQKLGEDIYRYFGLGCRNVSKIFIPAGYDIKDLLDQLNGWIFLADHHKYANNYDYNRAIYSMEQIPFLDNGFSLFTENDHLVSPTAVVYYQFYDNQEKLISSIHENGEKIQCIVADQSWYEKSIPFGKAQKPDVWDYADNVDTMKFLLSL